MNLVCQLKAINVPDTVQHKSRNEEIKKLPDYLTIESLGVDNLYMVNIGDTEPSTDQTSYPWVVTDSSGVPYDFRRYNDGEWQSVLDTENLTSDYRRCVYRDGAADGDPVEADRDKLWVDITAGKLYLWDSGSSSWAEAGSTP